MNAQLTLTFYAFFSHPFPKTNPTRIQPEPDPDPNLICTHPRHEHSDTIPEESSYQHGHSKSLCEPADGDDWDAVPLATTASAGGAKGDKLLIVQSGREPLLPRQIVTSTPRSQIRHMKAGAVGGVAVGVPGSKNQVTTALLDYEDTDSDSEDGQGDGVANVDDDDDDDEGEDFDLYDDENIVVTTFTTPATPRLHELPGGRRLPTGTGASSGVGGTTTTTSIRLTRNNDESII